MKVAYIMRGVPGSGKSTVARMLAGEKGVIHSTDNFFYDVDGEYHFDLEQLQGNHDHNFEAFCHSLSDGIPIVICDNTNVKRCHFERYVEAAKRAGYIVAFVVMTHPKVEVATQRTLHKVSPETIQKMIDEWET